MVQTEGRAKFSVGLRSKLQVARLVLSTNESSPTGLSYQRKLFREYLVALHSIIRSSVPLLKLAEQRCLQLPEQEFHSVLARYYHRHAIEERDHDKWLLGDLEATGMSPRDVLSRRPNQSVAELVGSQYYWISYLHPVCLLGYIAVLEGYPPQPSDLERLMEQTGYPKAAFRTLVKHSSLDPHHRDDLYRFLDELNLEKRQKEWITLNAIYTVGKWKEILDAIHYI